MLVLTTVLALPLVGLFFFRIYENQLIHQTESELIGQCAVLAAVVRGEIDADFPKDIALGAAVKPAPPADPQEIYQPIAPSLDLTGNDLFGQRPDALPTAAPTLSSYAALGAGLTPILIETQRATLAGFRLLDPNGIVIAGREEVGLSLAHIEEVAAALGGNFRSVMRMRISKHPPPPLYSWSRGTAVRIFVAMPVIVRGHVAAVIYASRTPSNVFRSFYEEGRKLTMAGLSVVALTALIGFVLHRAFTRPMRELMLRTAAIGRGERDAFAPLAHHGTAEFAQLSQSFLDMATNLRNRSDFVATFAAHVSHELKSPLTAIQGAAELLRDDIDAADGRMNAAERRLFLDNIIGDAGRLTAIVQRLRELARAENSPVDGVASLTLVVAEIRSGFGKLEISAEGDLDGAVQMSSENLRIVLTHLVDNAARHGATRVEIKAVREADKFRVTVSDNGGGISANNRGKIFDNFFTTRRESGGTGMGLAIVRAMLVAHGGQIELQPINSGAKFLLTLPAAGQEVF
ncbi:MAG: HAMP domain-containing sensor histidine kinase [Alphaproteobacteria bacterium]|nr:HAMP domain-containing sensor histidine kinase [Alphaproteobacteria bacterium]